MALTLMTATVVAACGATEEGPESTSKGTHATDGQAPPSSSASPSNHPTAPSASQTEPAILPRKGDAVLLDASQLPSADPGFTWVKKDDKLEESVAVCQADVPFPSGGTRRDAEWSSTEESGAANADAVDAVINSLTAPQLRNFTDALNGSVVACKPDEARLAEGMPVPSAQIVYSGDAGLIIEHGEILAPKTEAVPRAYIVVSTNESSLHISRYYTIDGAVSLIDVAVGILEAQVER